MDTTTEPPKANVVPVVLFTLCYLVASIGGAVVRGNLEFVLYIGVMVILIGAVGRLHRQVALSQGALWGLSIWGLLHMAGGLVPVPQSWPIDGSIRVLYSLWLLPEHLKYDQVVHAYGFGMTTWVCWQALQSSLAVRMNRSKAAVAATPGWLALCVAAGMGFGAMNEVIEFAATLLVPETNVGGYENTGWDLVSNLVGCLVAAAAIWSTRRR